MQVSHRTLFNLQHHYMSLIGQIIMAGFERHYIGLKKIKIYLFYTFLKPVICPCLCIIIFHIFHVKLSAKKVSQRGFSSDCDHSQNNTILPHQARHSDQSKGQSIFSDLHLHLKINGTLDFQVEYLIAKILHQFSCQAMVCWHSQD